MRAYLPRAQDLLDQLEWDIFGRRFWEIFTRRQHADNSLNILNASDTVPTIYGPLQEVTHEHR